MSGETARGSSRQYARHGLIPAGCNEPVGTDGGNRRERQGGRREAMLKEAGNKALTVGTRIGREAAYGR